jgi:hypothetical protein
MDKKVLDGFKKDFLAIKEKGWISSNRFHDTGIGKTFEDFIGVIENNKSSADYGGVLELKSTRDLSESMVTLFTKSPNPRGTNTKLRQRFGYFDEEHKDMKILHTTFSGDKFNTCADKFGFALDIDEEKQRINIKIKNIKKDHIEEIEAFYPFEKLKKIIESKCKTIVLIDAESKKENGVESFKFNKAVLLTGLTFEIFLKAIKDGIIKYDIRLGVYRTGDKKGKTHDHGSGFRVLRNNIPKVFKVEEV